MFERTLISFIFFRKKTNCFFSKTFGSSDRSRTSFEDYFFFSLVQQYKNTINPRKNNYGLYDTPMYRTIFTKAIYKNTYEYNSIYICIRYIKSLRIYV